MKYNNLVRSIKFEFPKFLLLEKKNCWHQRAINFSLKVLTFGKTKYSSEYVTTIGNTIFTPSVWNDLTNDEKYIVLRHELVHLRQFRKFTLVGMFFLYLFIPFPICFAYFRTKFEKAGYAETIKTAAEIYGIDFVKGKFKKSIVNQFTSSQYLWMWPFRRSIERWYDSVVDSLTSDKS